MTEIRCEKCDIIIEVVESASRLLYGSSARCPCGHWTDPSIENKIEYLLEKQDEREQAEAEEIDIGDEEIFE